MYKDWMNKNDNLTFLPNCVQLDVFYNEKCLNGRRTEGKNKNKKVHLSDERRTGLIITKKYCLFQHHFLDQILLTQSLELATVS